MAESSESSRKRARKSKLVPRDCVEFEEENNTRAVQEPELAVQALLPKLRTGLDHDSYESSAPPMQFSINVEVEQCEEHYSNYEPEEITSTSLKQCIKEESAIRSNIEELWKTTTNLADKQLEIEIRNHWGKCLQPVKESPFDNMLQQAINNWRVWSSQSKYRESFLLYKCYECEIGWWHLMPFQDHIKQHEGIKVNIELCHHESNLTAYVNDFDSTMRDITIEGECWRCLKTFDEHIVSKRQSNMYYFCVACNSNFFSCSALVEHEGICQKYHKLHLKDEIRHETDWRCSICQLICLTKARYDSHLVGRHSVRSDFVVSTVSPKFCVNCHGKYMVYNLHICPKKTENYQCTYCCRRFQSKHFASLHMKMTKSNYFCRICDIFLRKQCMEMEHMIEHSRNYMLAYRCSLCSESILFPNEYSLRRHRVFSHGMKFDKRRGYLDMLVVPKKSMNWINMDVSAPVVNQPPAKRAAEPPVAAKETKSNTEDHVSARESQKDETQQAVEEIQETKPEIDDASEIKKEIEEAEIAIANLLQESLNKKRDGVAVGSESISPVEVKTEVQEIKVEKEDYEEFDEHVAENYNSYEHIDIDIKREQDEYIETLSKVFQASKYVSNRKTSNTSLLKKELISKGKDSTPESVVKTETPHAQEETASKQKVVKKRRSSKKIPDTKLLQEELLLAEKAFQSDHAATEEIDTYFLQEGLTVKDNTIKVAKHITGEEISPKSLLQGHQIKNNVFQGQELPDIESFIHEEVIIKEEPMDEDDYEEDIIVLNASFDTSMNSGNEDIKTEPSTSDVTENSLPDVKKATTLKPRIRIKVKKRGEKMYKCMKCSFVGPHNQYHNHKLLSCPRKKHPRQPRALHEKVEKRLWKEYPCTKCGTTFPSIMVYVEHFAAAHNLPRGGCPQCCIVRMETATLASHIMSHIKLAFVKIHMIKETTYVSSRVDGVYHCKECSATVRFKEFFSHWESHVKLRKAAEVTEASAEREEVAAGSAHSKLSPDKLRKIISQLVTPWERRGHEQYLEKGCVVCGRGFGRRNDVKRHLVEHLLADAYADKARHAALRCQVCAAKHQAPDKYKQHMRQHASMPLYKCELCNRAFSDSSNFAKHKKVHNLQVLVCDICQKKFQSKTQLERHIEMHRVTEPIKCSGCEKQFYSESSYKKHYRSAHEKHIQRFLCPICRVRFPRLRDKWDHMWRVHNERKFKADCPFCEQSYRKFQDVKSHVMEAHNVRLMRNKDDDSVIMYEYQ